MATKKPTYEELEVEVERLKALLATCEDVEINKIKLQAKDVEDRFSRIVNFSPTAMYFYRLEEENRLVLVGANPSADRIIGISHQELIGKTIEEAFPNLAQTQIPENYRKVARGEISSYSFEIPYSDHRINGYYSVDVFQTKKNEIAVDFVDISDRKRSEELLNDELEVRKQIQEQLQQSQNLLSKTEEIAQLGSWMFVLSTNQLIWSDQVYRIFGFTPNEFEPSYEVFLSLIHPDDREKVDSVYVNSLREGKDNYEIEHRIIQKGTNEVRYVYEKCLHYKNIEGRVVRSVGIVQDITKRKHQEDALLESKERFKSIIRVSNTGAWEFNSKLNYLWCSPEYFTMLGYNPESFSVEEKPNLEETWINLLHSEDREIASKKFKDYLDGGSVGMYESYFRMQHASGTWVWIWSRGQTLRDKQGNLTNLTVGTHIDITERKNAEEELIKTRTLLDAAFEQSPVPLAMATVPDMVFRYINSAAADFLGIDVNNYRMKSLTEIPITWKELKADGSEWSIEEQLNSLPMPRALQGLETKNLELQIKLADGRLKWELASGAPIRDGQGNLIAGLLVMQDITDRKKAEEALRDSEAKLSALFASMTELVVLHELVFDKNGNPIDYRITDCNEAYTKSTGISKVEAVGRLGTEVYQQPDPPYLKEFIDVAITGVPFLFETYYTPMDKHFSISVVSPGKNKFATVTTDVTPIKQIQQIIAAKNKELEQIVYVASHDLRSPLVNVDGYSRELEFSLNAIKTALAKENVTIDEYENTLCHEVPEMLEALGHIRASTRQMDALLKGLLKLSRSGRAALSIGTLDMNTLINQACSSFEFQLKEKGVEINVYDLPNCKGDAVQITQVFSNLIDNAIKYCDPKKVCKIKISGKVEYGKSVYTIEDNGIGIAQNHLENIFELFHRLNPKHNDGEGLGLTIVRQILSRLDGEIKVESSTGIGSKFFVSLPFATIK